MYRLSSVWLSASWFLLAQAQIPEQPAYDLLERVLPNLFSHGKSSQDYFLLELITEDDSPTPSPFISPMCELPCFSIEILPPIQPNVTIPLIGVRGGPTLRELTAGIGWYFRNIANATSLDIWPPMNITNYTHPTYDINTDPSTTFSPWIQQQERILPYSYLTNVCTHSYSLVWYSAQDWVRFIDWMALSGINRVLALTGQEWIQYQVFRKLGISDNDIRHWFNGPAFLTWSRGQNEYGNNIAGPLPISWMKQQWKMQREVILPRLRELGIVGILPAFQGNVPIQLKEIYQDSNITKQGDTGWMDSLDPLFRVVAKDWMETMIRDFGTDHWYQLDGYFNGGTAPWLSHQETHSMETTTEGSETMYGNELPDHDEQWYQRGVAAYRGLNDTDPEAIWCFQGFAFVGWETAQQASYLRGFIDSVPRKEDFVIMDMSYDVDDAEWKKWNRSAFFGASYIWTTLHNFGGTDGIKGDMRKLHRMRFDDSMSLPVTSGDGAIVGLGATPEGITQNPAYYDLLYDLALRRKPVDLVPLLIDRVHRRYGLCPLISYHNDIANAWLNLLDSLYSTDRSVQDKTGVAHLVSFQGASLFDSNRFTPTETMCKVFDAWTLLLSAAVDSRQENIGFDRTQTFQYDLVNLGREVLAQLSTPMSLNFTDALAQPMLNATELHATRDAYVALLLDLDELVASEETFLLGRWLESARQLGTNTDDCEIPVDMLGPRSSHWQLLRGKTTASCALFYEWNARVQVTTWNPTPWNATKVPGGPIDYAAKHWSGLIRDYYARRIVLITEQALKDAALEQPLNQTLVDLTVAKHAYNWTTLQVFGSMSTTSSAITSTYSTNPTGDYVDISRQLHDKYGHWFSSCLTSSSGKKEVSVKQ